jgi:hypothetical protein
MEPSEPTVKLRFCTVTANATWPRLIRVISCVEPMSRCPTANRVGLTVREKSPGSRLYEIEVLGVLELVGVAEAGLDVGSAVGAADATVGLRAPAKARTPNPAATMHRSGAVMRTLQG